ncbi:FAD-dependent oxidoreductase [bacterium]|nr:FAD-dependent oxidoreductase [bacterium]
MKNYYDNIIIGGGIIGLSIAREIIKKNDSKTSILLIEKESKLGLHASGRNSGVLHSGVYYSEGSEKAKHCYRGSMEMHNFCLDNGISIKKIGKIILPTSIQDEEGFNVLLSRATSRKNNVELLDKQQLVELEPFANPAMEKAIYFPNTIVVNSGLVISKLYEILCNNVRFEFGSEITSTDPEKSIVVLKEKKIKYGKLYNCSGQNIDKVAGQFGASKQYTMIPIKGTYYKLKDNSNITINHLIYPVPDLNVPFLGIHTLNTTQDETYFGPSAMPVFGREQYRYFDSIKVNGAINIARNLSMLYLKDIDGFRKYANNEVKNFGKSGFVKSVRKLIPSLENHDISKSEKVGIRAQLVNKKTLKFEMDFLIEKQDNVVHILNAVSPAFTCSFSLAKSILDYSDGE